METVRRIINWIVLTPLAILFIIFALANRQGVILRLSPLSDTTDGMQMPLFLLILLFLGLGILLGSFLTWNAQRHWRSAAKRHAREVEELRAELLRLKTPAAPQAAMPEAWPILPPI